MHGDADMNSKAILNAHRCALNVKDCQHSQCQANTAAHRACVQNGCGSRAFGGLCGDI